MDLNQFDKFIKQVNEVCCCATPGYNGALTPVYAKSVGLGGAVSISCTCNGCGNRGAIFETSSKYMYELGDATEISVAIQVAFIIAGCTHMTYYKILKHALGIEAVSWSTFYSTIKRMYPVLKEMVDKTLYSLSLHLLSFCHTHTHFFFSHSLLSCSDLLWQKRAKREQHST